MRWILALVLVGVAAGQHSTCTLGRLFVSDVKSSNILALDLDSGIATSIARSDVSNNPVVSTNSDRSHAYVSHRTKTGAVRIFHSGVLLDEHGDHFDINIGAPSELPVHLDGGMPTHVAASNGQTTIVFDGPEEAHVRVVAFLDGKESLAMFRSSSEDNQHDHEHEDHAETDEHDDHEEEDAHEEDGGEEGNHSEHADENEHEGEDGHGDDEEHKDHDEQDGGDGNDDHDEHEDEHEHHLDYVFTYGPMLAKEALAGAMTEELYFVTAPNATGVWVVDKTGERVYDANVAGDLDRSCPGLRGHGAYGEYQVFGCTTGILVIHHDLATDTTTSRQIEYIEIEGTSGDHEEHDDHEHGDQGGDVEQHDAHDEHDEEDGHDSHDEHDEADGHESHDEHDEEDGHESHDEHDEEDGHESHDEHDEEDGHDSHDEHDEGEVHDAHEHDDHDEHAALPRIVAFHSHQGNPVIVGEYEGQSALVRWRTGAADYDKADVLTFPKGHLVCGAGFELVHGEVFTVLVNNGTLLAYDLSEGWARIGKLDSVVPAFSCDRAHLDGDEHGDHDSHDEHGKEGGHESHDEHDEDDGHESHDEHDEEGGHESHDEHDEEDGHESHDEHDEEDGHESHDEHDEEDGHDSHDEHDEEDGHESHDQHDEEDGHDSHDEHDEEDGHDHDDEHDHHEEHVSASILVAGYNRMYVTDPKNKKIVEVVVSEDRLELGRKFSVAVTPGSGAVVGLPADQAEAAACEVEEMSYEVRMVVNFLMTEDEFESAKGEITSAIAAAAGVPASQVTLTVGHEHDDEHEDGHEDGHDGHDHGEEEEEEESHDGHDHGSRRDSHTVDVTVAIKTESKAAADTAAAQLTEEAISSELPASLQDKLGSIVEAATVSGAADMDDAHDDAHDDSGACGDVAWVGVADLLQGNYTLMMSKVDGEYAVDAVAMVVRRVRSEFKDQLGELTEEAEEELECDDHAGHDHGEEEEEDHSGHDHGRRWVRRGLRRAGFGQGSQGEHVALGAQESKMGVEMDWTAATTLVTVEVAESGRYVFFSTHAPYLLQGSQAWLVRSDGEEVEFEELAGGVECSSGLSSSEVWGFSFLAALVCAMMSLAGVFLLVPVVRNMKQQLFQYLHALACGVLLALVVVHLIPEAMALADKPWKVSACLMAGFAAAMYLEHFIRIRNHEKERLKAEYRELNNTDHGHEVPAATARVVPVPPTPTKNVPAAFPQPPPSLNTSLHPSNTSLHGLPTVAQLLPGQPVAPSPMGSLSFANPVGYPGSYAGGYPGGAPPMMMAPPMPVSAGLMGAQGFGMFPNATGSAPGAYFGQPPSVQEYMVTGSAFGNDEPAVLENGSSAGQEGSVDWESALPNAKALAINVIVGDLFHNFFDGVIIAMGFRVCGHKMGWTVTAAAVLHELPQELSDFIILIESGISVPMALGLNFMSSLSAIFGAFMLLGLDEMTDEVDKNMGIILGCGAGFLLYIATSLVPGLLAIKDRRKAGQCWLVFAVGAVIIGLLQLWHEHCACEDPSAVTTADDPHAGHNH